MPLQYIPDNTIGDALAQLGNTISNGPQTMLHAAVAGEQIKTSAQKRMELQNELDAKQAAADATAQLDSLTEQKRQAGPAWTPEQETQLIGAKTRFGEAVTRGSSLLGKSAEDFTKGVYASRGQQDLSIAPALPGSPRYLQQMGQIEGKLPAPQHEDKAPYSMVFGDGTGRTISVVTKDGQRNAYSGAPIQDEVPAGFRPIGIGSPMAIPTQGYGSKEKNANDLQIANQQILANQQPNESLASLAQKYYDLNPTKHQLQNDKFGGQMVVGMSSEAANPGLEAIHQHLAANYYSKGGTSKFNPPTAGATTPLPGATAQPGAGGLFSPQSMMGGASSGVQTSAIPASQVPTNRLPSTADATGQPAAATAPALPEGITKLPDGRVVWRPSAAPPTGGVKDIGGGATVQQLTQGYSQPLQQEFSNAQVAKDWRISDEAYNELQSAAKYNSKAADLHMIYLLAKIFDPGSAVREGELVLGQGTQSPANKFLGLWSQIRGGGSLTAEAKADLLNQAYTSANARFGAAVNLAKDVNSQIMASGALNPAEHLPREMVQPAMHDTREINRFAGSQMYTGKGVGEHADTDQAELIKMAGQVVGGAPGQTSTSAGGAPAVAATSSGRSGANIAPAPPTASGAPPGGPIQQLLNDADAITGRRRR
jgi:hypothetical protein